MDTNAIQNTTEQIVYQVVPEAYQNQVMWFVGVAISIVSIYYFMKPFLDNLRNNKQIAAIDKNALTQENITEAVNKAIALKDKTDTQLKIKEWEYKLLYATTDEAKDFINQEIAELKAKL